MVPKHDKGILYRTWLKIRMLLLKKEEKYILTYSVSEDTINHKCRPRKIYITLIITFTHPIINEENPATK